MRITYIGLGLVVVLQALTLLNLLPLQLDFVRIVLLWSLAFSLLLKLSPSTLLLGKRNIWWDVAAIACFFLLSFPAVSQTFDVGRDALLIEPFTTVTFAATDWAELEIPVSESFSGGALPQAAGFARAFGAQDTFLSAPARFAIKSPNEVNYFVLEPYGINGFLLQLYNTLVNLTDTFVLVGLLFLFVLALWSLQINLIVKSKSLHSFLIKFLLTVCQILLYGILVSWYSILVLVDEATFAFLFLIMIILLPQASQIRGFVVDYAQKFRKLFTNVRLAPTGIAGLLVLHLLLDGFGLAGGILRFIGACTLYTLIVYMWHKTLMIRTQEGHPHSPHLPHWLVAFSTGALAGFFLADTYMSAIGVVSLMIITYLLIKTAFMYRAVMSMLFLCSILFIAWYAYLFFMSEITLLLPEALIYFYTGGFAWVLGLWTTTILLVNAIFSVVGVFSFTYELVRD